MSYQQIGDDKKAESWWTPILSYCTASIMMTLLNKFVLSGFDISMVFFVLATQAFMCSFILIMLERYVNTVSFKKLDKVTVKQFFPVSVSMALMLFTSGKALEYMNIPVFTIFKNLTIIVIAYGDHWLNGTPISRLMVISFLLMVASSLVAAGSDITFSTIGYFWTILNVFSSAYYVLFIRKKIRKLQFREYDTVFYNNMLVLPIFTFLSIFGDDWTKFMYISINVGRNRLPTFLYFCSASL
eukprot:NODE_409_length_9212_cov_0.585537.p5 type:complete len:242 gc:universal NODE_409_length_9212_cov_0.585537:6637-5912(-)